MIALKTNKPQITVKTISLVASGEDRMGLQGLQSLVFTWAVWQFPEKSHCKAVFIGSNSELAQQELFFFFFFWECFVKNNQWKLFNTAADLDGNRSWGKQVNQKPWGFPSGSVVKNSPAMQETQKMQVWSLDSGRSHGEGNGNPL